MREVTKEWLDQANYDLKTAEAMLKTGRYLYVTFMCQQAVEKILKAIIYERSKESAPYSHRLPMLLELARIEADQKQLDLLGELTNYYINCRYPEQKRKLAKFLNKKSSQSLLKKTKECFQPTGARHGNYPFSSSCESHFYSVLQAFSAMLQDSSSKKRLEICHVSRVDPIALAPEFILCGLKCATNWP